MVLHASFSSNTPHGGPPFTKWKNGWGFGKRLRSYMSDPMIMMPGRMSPTGNAYYDSARFWKGRAEVGQCTSFGIGDRPEYGQEQKNWSVSPDNYGDITKVLSASRRDVVYKNLTVKSRMKDREADPRLGPGPKYDLRIPAGESGWMRGSKCPKWTINTRHLDTSLFNEESAKPGAANYTTSKKPGTNPLTSHGTLYDITFRDKTVLHRPNKNPGPGKYSLPRLCDEYNVTPHFKQKTY
eukprot:GEMP01053315.1.p1 GENE.GEMP01053315.1~~GEMP01053315.1.p1  ORF type:complete len:248 (+),score=35.14 GEMP01053315.1:28-744(+)